MELDPSQFLAQGSSDDESDNDDEQSRAESLQNGNGPSFLTSLGLTHVNSVTPSQFGSLAVSWRSKETPLSVLTIVFST
jgi:hypothetical protein